MLFLAAAATTANLPVVERLRQIPSEVWLKLGLGVVAIIVAVVLLRKFAKMNKVVLTVGAMLACTIVGFNWIYERNEPQWASPAVEFLAGFLPTKGKAMR